MGRTPQASRRGKRAPAAWGLRASWFEGENGRRIVTALAASYAVLFTTLCAIKFHFYLYRDFDLAIFTQAVDGLLRGRMYASIRGMNWLGDHSSFNLFLVAPLYAVLRTPLTFLTLQSVALALGAIPVHRLARRTLGDGFAAVVCVALYLAYPALGFTNLYEFHPEVLSTTPLLFLLDAVHAGRPRAALGWAFLALLGKEDVALFVMALGLLVLARRGPHRRMLSASLIGLGGVFLAITFLAIKPRLSGTEASYGDMYRQWGEGTRGVVLGLLSHPLGALRACFDTPGDPADAALKRWFHLHLLLPLGFLPLAAPLELVPALPILAEHLLSWRDPQHQITYQYTALLTPAYVVAAIFGMRRVRDRLARRGPSTSAARAAWIVPACALAASLAGNLAFGPLRNGSGLGLPEPEERVLPSAEERTLAGVRDRVLRELPPRGTVVAGFEYLARLATRPDPVISAHHVLLGTYTFSRKAFPVPTGVRAAILEAVPTYYGDSSAVRLRALAALNGLHPVAARGSVLLLAADRRAIDWVTVGVAAESTRASVVFDGALEFLSARIDSVATVGETLTIRTNWRRVGRVGAMALTQFSLLDPAGRVVTMRAHPLGYPFDPVSLWPERTSVRESYRLVLDRGLAPGGYSLAMRVGWRGADGSVVDATDGRSSGDATVDLGSFEVRGRSR